MKRPEDDKNKPRRGWIFTFVVGAIVIYFFYRYTSVHGISAVMNL